MKKLSLVEVQRAYQLVNGTFNYDTGTNELEIIFHDHLNTDLSSKFACEVKFNLYTENVVCFDRFTISAPEITELVRRVNKILNAIDWTAYTPVRGPQST